MTTGPVEAARPGEQRPARRHWGFVDVAITLVGTVLVASVLAGVLHALEQGPWSSPTAKAWASVLALVVPWVVLGGWPLLAAWRRGDGPVRDYGLRLGWRDAVIGLVGGLVALLAASVVATVQVALTHRHFDSAVGDLASTTTSASRAALVVLALCTAFGAPVVEELAFRGLTYGAFLRSQPVPWAALWTTVIFAAFHFEPVRLPVLLVLGGFLVAVRQVTASTSASMVAHMAINVTGAVELLRLAGH